jgi:hypothetical protein
MTTRGEVVSTAEVLLGTDFAGGTTGQTGESFGEGEGGTNQRWITFAAGVNKLRGRGLDVREAIAGVNVAQARTIKVASTVSILRADPAAIAGIADATETLDGMVAGFAITARCTVRASAVDIRLLAILDAIPAH